MALTMFLYDLSKQKKKPENPNKHTRENEFGIKNLHLHKDLDSWSWLH